MRVKENLSSVVSSIGKNNFSPARKAQVGRVYGVVTTENTPTKEMFEKVGGYSGIGTIFYLDYEQSKNVIGTIDNNFLNTCKILSYIRRISFFRRSSISCFSNIKYFFSKILYKFY